MKGLNQNLVDIVQVIQPGGLSNIDIGCKDLNLVPITEIEVRKGFHCKLNDILYFCQKIENGEVLDPIEINKNNVIVDGAKRYFAYKRMKNHFVQVKGSGVYIEEFIGQGFRIVK